MKPIVQVITSLNSLRPMGLPVDIQRKSECWDYSIRPKDANP